MDEKYNLVDLVKNLLIKIGVGEKKFNHFEKRSKWFKETQSSIQKENMQFIKEKSSISYYGGDKSNI